MSVLLLSDLHLPTAASPLRERFIAFLAGPARNAERVYILGDLFEVWIGDDVGQADYAAEIEALQGLSSAGVRLGIQRGNRDFLLGRRFVDTIDAELLPDPIAVDLPTGRALLSHGDIWCTDDTGYQRWRAFSRNRLAQWLFLRLPVATRERIAGGLRSQSSERTRQKAEDIMDVNPAAIETAFREHGVDTMIHGHTHRPAEHALRIDGRDCRRRVLPDWRPERMEYLRVSADGEALLSAL